MRSSQDIPKKKAVKNPLRSSQETPMRQYFNKINYSVLSTDSRQLASRTRNVQLTKSINSRNSGTYGQTLVVQSVGSVNNSSVERVPFRRDSFVESKKSKQ